MSCDAGKDSAFFTAVRMLHGHFTVTVTNKRNNDVGTNMDIEGAKSTQQLQHLSLYKNVFSFRQEMVSEGVGVPQVFSCSRDYSS